MRSDLPFCRRRAMVTTRIGMDLDPELDVILSNGRERLIFQILALHGPSPAWAITEPHTAFRVVLTRAEALESRHRVDRHVAALLEAGWIPLDRDATSPSVPPTPLPRDLALQI